MIDNKGCSKFLRVLASTLAVLFGFSFSLPRSFAQEAMTEERKTSLLNEAILQIAKNYNNTPCYQLPLADPARKEVTPQHFAFPRSLVFHSDPWHGYGCKHGRCSPLEYFKLTPIDIAYQSYGPGEKKYFYNIGYHEIPDAPTDEQLNRFAISRGDFLGYGYFNVAKVTEPYSPAHKAVTRYFANAEEQQSTGTGVDVRRPPGDRHKPYVTRKRPDNMSDQTWRELVSKWAWMNQAKREALCDQQPESCILVTEMCYQDQYAGYSNNVPKDSDQAEFLKNEGALSIGYEPFTDTPVYWGHLVTSNYDFAKNEAIYNAMQTALVFTQNLLPGGSIARGMACLDQSTFECWGAAAVDVAADVAMSVVPIARSGKAMKIVSFASLGRVSPGALEKAATHLYRFSGVGSAILAVAHAKRGEFVAAFGQALGTNIDFGIIARTKGTFNYIRWKKAKTFNPCPNGINEEAVIKNHVAAKPCFDCQCKSDFAHLKLPAVLAEASGSVSELATRFNSWLRKTISNAEHVSFPSLKIVETAMEPGEIFARHLLKRPDEFPLSAWENLGLGTRYKDADGLTWEIANIMVHKDPELKLGSTITLTCESAGSIKNFHFPPQSIPANMYQFKMSNGFNVRVNIPRTADDQYIEQIRRALENAPETLLASPSFINVFDETTMKNFDADAYTALSRQYYQKSYSQPAARAIGKYFIEIYPIKSTYWPASFTEEVLHHEFSHTMSNIKWNHPGGGAEWAQIVKSEGSLKTWSSYADEYPEWEDFPESVMYFIATRGTPRQKAFDEAFPARVKRLNELFMCSSKTQYELNISMMKLAMERGITIVKNPKSITAPEAAVAGILMVAVGETGYELVLFLSDESDESEKEVAP